MKVTIEELEKVLDSGNTDTMNDFLKNVCWQDLSDVLTEYRKAYDKEKLAHDSAEAAYRNDCREKDEAIQRERDSLQREINTQDAAIKAHSQKLTKALIAKDNNSVAALKQQIKAATEKRDEAAATLAALADVLPEYDQSLQDKADDLKAPVERAKEQLTNARYRVQQAVEKLHGMFDYDSRMNYPLRMIDAH